MVSDRGGFSNRSESWSVPPSSLTHPLRYTLGYWDEVSEFQKLHSGTLEGSGLVSCSRKIYLRASELQACTLG